MRKLILSSLAILCLGVAQAKTVKTVFNVGGKCEMCKTRIEKTTKSVKGVVSATWDQKTQRLAVVYDDKLTSPKDVQKVLLKIGHDAGGIKASQNAYNSLPECCKYRK